MPYLPGEPERLLRLGELKEEGERRSGTMTIGPWAAGPSGEPAHGSLGVALDVVWGGAAFAGRQPGQWAITTELSADFCAAMPPDGSNIALAARPLYDDGTAGVGGGTARTADGTLLAVGSTRVRYVEGEPAPGQSPALRPESEDATLLDLFEVTTRTRGDGECVLELPAGIRVANPAGTLHGGIMFCLSEIAASTAARAYADGLRATSVRIVFVRPGPANGSVRFVTRTAYRGRTAATIEVRCLRPDDKPCSLATVTFSETARRSEPSGGSALR